jgi:1,2-diacylglycerol 3-alpha-glucosyltransferase
VEFYIQKLLTLSKAPMTKVILFFANYGPYHIARLEGFAKIADQFNWQVVPLEITRSAIIYEWKTDLDTCHIPIISILDNQTVSKSNLYIRFKKLFLVLEKAQPNVVALCGYSLPSMLAALAWCHVKKVPAILLSESKEDDAQRFLLFEKMKSIIVKSYKSALVGGLSHKRYLEKLGIPSNSIFLGYDVVGNNFFHSINKFPRPSTVEKPYFLSINRFVPKKNLLFLLDAYDRYRRSTTVPWDLVICGSGELHLEITQKIANLHLTEYVHLPGFLQQNQLLPYFAHASCFIHASIQEQWGLVVNEAMAAGLPVLVSNRCGCYEDLVLEGVTGYGFDPENLEQLTSLMLKMSSDAFDLHSMGCAALQHIQKYSPEYFGQGLKHAIDHALDYA